MQQTINPEYSYNFLKFTNDLLDYHNIRVFKFGKFHEDCVDVVLRNRYVGIMLPVGHLKTTLFSICYPIWRMLTEEHYEMCLVSSTLDQSIKNLAMVQQLIEDTAWLKHLVPDDRGYSWNKSQLNTTNRNLLYVRPFSPSARGIHPNEIIYDDILREADISMDEIKDIFWHIFFPRGQTKHCKHTLIGTPISPNDLLFEIKEKAEKGSDWKFYSYPAIVYNQFGQPEPLWKERFKMEELYEIKKNMGDYRFSREYMCNPLAEGTNFFPLDMIMNCTDDDYAFTDNTTGTVFIGADFAMSESPRADYSVFTVVDCVKGKLKRKLLINGKARFIEVTDPIIIRYIDRFRGPTGHTRMLSDLAKKFKAERVIIDESTFGKRFEQELRDYGIPVSAQSFQSSARTNLLANLRKLMESENVEMSPPKLIIPTSFNNFTYDKTKHLIRELSGFQESRTRTGIITLASNVDHDDTVMSLALAVRDVIQSKQISTDLIKIFETD